MIDPLCLGSRILEACRPAAERAEERVAVAAAPIATTDEVFVDSPQACGAWAGGPDNSHHGAASSGIVPGSAGDGQRPKGQAARVAAYPVTRG